MSCFLCGKEQGRDLIVGYDLPGMCECGESFYASRAVCMVVENDKSSSNTENFHTLVPIINLQCPKCKSLVEYFIVLCEDAKIDVSSEFEEIRKGNNE